MNIVTNTISAAVVPLSAVFGSKLGGYVAQVSELPPWITPLLGPVGALCGTLIAIKWLLARLDRAEKKAETRDAERDSHLHMIATMTVQNQTIIEQNSEVLADVKDAIRKCVENKP